MVFADIWPFDFSCSGFVCIAFAGFIWLLWSVTSVAKDVVSSDVGKDVTKGLLENWIWSWFQD